jgi:hypothetical protein
VKFLNTTGQLGDAGAACGTGGGGSTVLSGYGRWGRSVWSHQNGNWLNTSDFPKGNDTCATSSDNGASAALPPWKGCGTGTTANTATAILFSPTNDTQIGSTTNPTNLHFIVYAAPISATTATRCWVAAISDQVYTTLAASDTPAGNNAAFRFSSVAGDTNYMAVLCKAGTCAATSTGIAAAAATWHHFEIDLADGTGTATFLIDGVATNTLTTDYPNATGANTFHEIIDNTTTTAESASVAYAFLSTTQ